MVPVATQYSLSRNTSILCSLLFNTTKKTAMATIHQSMHDTTRVASLYGKLDVVSLLNFLSLSLYPFFLPLYVVSRNQSAHRHSSFEVKLCSSSSNWVGAYCLQQFFFYHFILIYKSFVSFLSALKMTEGNDENNIVTNPVNLSGKQLKVVIAQVRRYIFKPCLYNLIS